MTSRKKTTCNPSCPNFSRQSVMSCYRGANVGGATRKMRITRPALQPLSLQICSRVKLLMLTPAGKTGRSWLASSANAMVLVYPVGSVIGQIKPESITEDKNCLVLRLSTEGLAPFNKARDNPAAFLPPNVTPSAAAEGQGSLSADENLILRVGITLSPPVIQFGIWSWVRYSILISIITFGYAIRELYRDIPQIRGAHIRNFLGFYIMVLRK